MRTILGIFLILASASALACSCKPLALAQQVAAADKIYMGQLLAASINNPAPGQARIIEAAVKVSEAYKGEVAKIEVVSTGLGGGDCGIPFTIGRHYIIFQTYDSYFVDICGASKQLDPRLEREFIDKVKALIKTGQ